MIKPFNCFLLLTGLNALLAYSPLAWPLKLAIGVLGFGTLGWFYFKNRVPAPMGGNPLDAQDIFNPASWITALVLLLALVVRLYKLTSTLGFPIPDEVINAYNAVHTNIRGNWDFFYYTSQMPPFYIWLLACVFKLGGVSSLNLWLVPALLSFLSVVFYDLAFREFFPRSFSFVCLLLLAVGFWPVFLGRFSHNAVLMVFWESLALWLLAKFSKANHSRSLAGLATGLGLWGGLGFYTYFGWVLVVLWLIPAFWVLCARLGKRGIRIFALGLAAALFSILPLAAAAWKDGFGDYLKDLFLTGRLAENTLQWNIRENLYYLTSLLWTGSTTQFAYNPQWGGFLNPILGSLFLLGLAGMFRSRSLPWVKWLAWGFAVLLIPCLFTHSANWYHLAALMPLFIGVTAWGFASLWPSLPGGSARLPLVLGLFLLSFLLDGANLEKSMGAAENEYCASNSTVTVCKNLEDLSRTNGPGLVYSDFCLDFNNSVITFVADSSGQINSALFTSHWFPCYTALGTYSFNARLNQGLDPSRATWAALTTDQWAQPLLSHWFSHAEFYTREIHTPSDNSLLALIPLTPENRKILDSWGDADQALRDSDYLQFNHPYLQPYDSIIAFLKGKETLFQDNPFLRFYYWGKLADLYYMNKQYDLAIPAFQKAFQNGENGFLFYDLSRVLGIGKRYADSKQAILRAAKWDSYFQPSDDVLRMLDALAAKNPPPPSGAGK